MSAGVPTATRLTITGTPWSAPPFTLNPKRPWVSGLMVTVMTPVSGVRVSREMSWAVSWVESGDGGKTEVSLTVLA